MERDGRLRLFVGLRLPEPVVEALAGWQQRELAGRSGIRVVAPDQLHVTVAFLGSRPASERGAIADAMRDAAAGVPVPVYRARRYRETERVGMVVLNEDLQPGDTAARRGTALAGAIMRALVDLGVYTPERRDWLPHVTVARFRSRPRLAPAVPDLGTFSPSEVALYHSGLRPTGAQYEILDAASLGG